LIGRERRKFKKRTASVEESIDAISGQELSPLNVSLTRRLGTARVAIQALLELFNQRTLRGGVSREGITVADDRARKSLHVHPPFELVMIN
jgi:hypothetical protein